MRPIVHNPPNMSEAAPTTRHNIKKWARFALRWGIAVAGIWWVLAQITWRDRVLLFDPATMDRPEEKRLANMPALDGMEFELLEGGKVNRGKLVSRPDQKKVTIQSNGARVDVELLGLRLTGDLKQVLALLVWRNDRADWISPAQAPQYKLKVPRPVVEVGIGRMVRDAASGNKPWLLVLSLVIFPITYVITSIRWHELLKAAEIYLPIARTFVLNMVGAFYNAFMLGTTGGDVLKAYYASKQTRHRTRAVMSVFVDRVIGLLALVLLGGSMAAYQYFTGGQDPASLACGRIAAISALVFIGVAGFGLVMFRPKLRRMIGLSWLLSKLPVQKQVSNAIQTLELYRRRKMMLLVTLVGTLPVHITVVVSAMLACKAFGLTLSPPYYFVTVPVVVLVGSIPISPQGAGVMEYFAVILIARQGGTVSQALAMTMSIRIVQIMWNLTGGIFVFRGGYHTLSEKERRELDDDDVAEAQAA